MKQKNPYLIPVGFGMVAAIFTAGYISDTDITATAGEILFYALLVAWIAFWLTVLAIGFSEEL